MRRERGFTLVEILTVVVIIGILSFIALPSISRWISHSNFTGFVRDVYTEFQQGRTRAVATGLAHQVVVDNVNSTVRLRRVSDNVFVRNLVSAPATCVISAGASVTFNADGTASGQGNVRIRNPNITADDNTITVTLGTGRVRIQ